MQSRRCNYGCVRCASSVNGGPCATSFSLVVRANVSVSVVQNSNRDRYIDCALSAPCALLQYRILSPAQPPLTGWRDLVSHENRSAGFMLLWWLRVMRNGVVQAVQYIGMLSAYIRTFGCFANKVSRFLCLRQSGAASPSDAAPSSWGCFGPSFFFSFGAMRNWK